MARARKRKATTRKNAKKAAAGSKTGSRRQGRAGKARPLARKAKAASAGHGKRAMNKKIAARRQPKPAKVRKAAEAKAGKKIRPPRASRRAKLPPMPKNEFWKVNALITAEIEKIGAGIASREAVEFNGNKDRPLLVRTAQTMLKNKVGLELKLLETEIKSGRMKVPQAKEEDVEEGEEGE